MKKDGSYSSSYDEVVQEMNEVARFAKTVKPWLKNEEVVTFSFCLSQQFRKDGILILNDRQVDEQRESFRRVDVDSRGPFWQTEISHVRLGGPEDPFKVWSTAPSTTILDTGTSLIGAPSWFVGAMVDFVDAHAEELGCSDTSLWPSLDFELNGAKLSLPGSSYVGRVLTKDGGFSGAAHILRRMPHLHSPRYVCTALVFSTSDGNEDSGGARDPDAPANPEWILGLPFFRAYYTAFRMSPNSMGPRRVYLAEADEECKVGRSRAFTRTTTAFGMPATIDPSKLRLPNRSMTWAIQESFRAHRQLLRGPGLGA